MFSPHTRGCSREFVEKQPVRAVFPAYAGMFRPHAGGGHRTPGFPRIRGDVPVGLLTREDSSSFSPHTRGCSCRATDQGRFFIVFPAYAGMFPHQAGKAGHRSGFPRIRGDVPGNELTQVMGSLFSPHTRGCSEPDLTHPNYSPVFPAYAGMFRTRSTSKVPPSGFPRIRGDVPIMPNRTSSMLTFSPHTRGCSLYLV